MPIPEEAVSAAEMSVCNCEPCKRKAGRPHNVAHMTIHAYSSEPRSGWVARRTTDPADATAPTFGVELETVTTDAPLYTELPGRPDYPPMLSWEPTEAERAEYQRAMDALSAWQRRNREHVARQERRWAASGAISAEEAVSLAAPRGMWHAKHDGSVSGPEFASQPGTLAYWRAQRPHLAGMFRSLLHGGMRSHDGDRAGLHVNIGRDAFDSAEHLARFAHLVCVNPRWAVRMSQRTHHSARWAAFDTLATHDQREQWAQEYWQRGRAGYEHTSVLNGTHPGRIEFRLPRGTLRLDRFYAKIEWAASMVEYTRDASRPVNVAGYIRWTADSGEYPAVTAYMRERFAARFENGGAA